MDLATVRQVREKWAPILDAIGSYESNSEVRKKSMSLHIKWGHDVDVLTTSTDFAGLVLNSPSYIDRLLRELEQALVTIDELNGALDVMVGTDSTFDPATRPADRCEWCINPSLCTSSGLCGPGHERHEVTA